MVASDRLAPLRRAVAGWWQSPRLATTVAPHVRDGISVRRIMQVMIVALLPCLLLAMWNVGLQAHLAMHEYGLDELYNWREQVFRWLGVGHDPAYFGDNLLLGALHILPMLLVAWVTAFFWEALFAVTRGLEMNEGWGVTGLLLALILPPAMPLWQVALGTSFAIVLGKEIFGGTGRNFLNPALTAYAFLFFAYPAQFSANTAYVVMDGVSRATPLMLAAEGGLELVSQSLSWTQAALGAMVGAPGETSLLACAFGAALLLVTGVASWRTMMAVLVGSMGLAALFYLLGSDTNPMFSLPPHWHLVLGSLAFGLVFMATDPVSSALTPGGKWAYGILVGVMIVLVRVLNPAFPEGTMLAILLGNVFAPVMDRFVIKAGLRRRRLRHGQ